jgi:hypothetical protein
MLGDTALELKATHHRLGGGEVAAQMIWRTSVISRPTASPTSG